LRAAWAVLMDWTAGVPAPVHCFQELGHQAARDHPPVLGWDILPREDVCVDFRVAPIFAHVFSMH
jgi:hypothetical protein